jgi:hypothetical protein
MSLSPIFTCSTSDLYTLAALLGGEMLLGLPDPFPGWLHEEIVAAMQKSQQHLTERGWLAPHPGGGVTMDVLPAALVGAMVQPQSVFLFTISEGSQPPQQQTFYLRPPLTVHLQAVGEDWQLSPLEAAEILPRIEKAWALQGQKAGRGERLEFPQAALERGWAAREQGEAAVLEALRADWLSAAQARLLARLLSGAVRRSAVVALRRRGEGWETDGLAMLAGPAGLWKLRALTRSLEERVEAQPLSASALRADLRALVTRFLPAEVA